MRKKKKKTNYIRVIPFLPQPTTLTLLEVFLFLLLRRDGWCDLLDRRQAVGQDAGRQLRVEPMVDMGEGAFLIVTLTVPKSKHCMSKTVSDLVLSGTRRVGGGGVFFFVQGGRGLRRLSKLKGRRELVVKPGGGSSSNSNSETVSKNKGRTCKHFHFAFSLSLSLLIHLSLYVILSLSSSSHFLSAPCFPLYITPQPRDLEKGVVVL